MRNIIIMKNDGSYYSCDYPGKIDPYSKKNMKKFFSMDGKIVIMPLKESLIYLYDKKHNDHIVEQLNDCKDTYNAYIIINMLSETNDPPTINNMTAHWTRNSILSELYSKDLYTEDHFLIIDENVLNNTSIMVTHDEFDIFVNEINDIFAATYTNAEKYLNNISIFVDDKTIFNFDKSESLTFQRDYIGTKQKNEWDEIVPLNNGDTIVRKTGLMLYQCANDAEIYFMTNYKYDNILDKHIEILC